ncbi:endonuclease domain-containing protein [Thalassobacillus hwangdonensis]|uniref:Endonuclease domain-containing protein n=1 Tax=Thalassobacillus hwangdonensis TaxID=546108 RepID=A0ABW3KZY2_9BACI
MLIIEAVVFFSLLIGVVILALIYKPPQQEAPFDSELAKCESPIERRLYNGLVSVGLYPRTQYPVGKYRIDIAFVGQKIAIEADGKAYHSTPEQKAHDRKKNRYLKKNGWKVMRFTGSQIHRSLPRIVTEISKELNT